MNLRGTSAHRHRMCRTCLCDWRGRAHNEFIERGIDLKSYCHGFAHWGAQTPIDDSCAQSSNKYSFLDHALGICNEEYDQADLVASRELRSFARAAYILPIYWRTLLAVATRSTIFKRSESRSKHAVRSL